MDYTNLGVVDGLLQLAISVDWLDRGHDKPMGVAIAIDPFQVVYFFFLKLHGGC